MLTGIDIEGNELSLNIFLVMSGKLEQVGSDSRKNKLTMLMSQASYFRQ